MASSTVEATYMCRFALTYETTLSEQQIEARLDGLMEALMKENVDPAIGWTINRRELEIDASVAAAKIEDAIQIARTKLEGALNEAGSRFADSPAIPGVDWVCTVQLTHAVDHQPNEISRALTDLVVPEIPNALS